MRNIIQIAVAPETEANYYCVTALCDDGTIWERPSTMNPENDKWTQIPNVPQPEEPTQ